MGNFSGVVQIYNILVCETLSVEQIGSRVLFAVLRLVSEDEI